jgi:hypothetical protein
MSEKQRISRPSSGSNMLGTETNEIEGSGLSAGTDTQTKLAALSTKKKHKNNINDDEKVVKNKGSK